MSEPIESWRQVLRTGVLPNLSLQALEAAAKGLREDDVRLIQGSTTTPPPLMCVADWKIEAADFIVYGMWQAGEVKTVGEAEEAFATVCFDADQLLGDPAACRFWLNHWDETPRAELFRDTLAEVLECIRARYENNLKAGLADPGEDEPVHVGETTEF